MHEVSLGGTLRDYLSGEEIEETTYEEFRQALVRILVEEKGYPKDRIKAKVKLPYVIDGEEFDRAIDYIVYDENDKPLFLIIFCAGDVGTYERETLFAAKLVQDGPAPFSLITDTMDASLIDTSCGECIEHGMRAIPDWEQLLKMAAEAKNEPLTVEQKDRVARVFHTYNGFLFGSCCNESCEIQSKK